MKSNEHRVSCFATPLPVAGWNTNTLKYHLPWSNIVRGRFHFTASNMASFHMGRISRIDANSITVYYHTKEYLTLLQRTSTD